MSKRVEQMNELFRRAVSEFMLSELEIPKELIATVTTVSISPDLKNLDVFLSVYPIKFRGKGLAFLNKNISRLSKYLKRKLPIRIIPKINYKIDAAEDGVEEIEKLFQEIEEGN